MATDARFRFWHPVVVRFRDIDVGGHAHHSEALMYFEEARWAYWGAVVRPEAPTEVNYVLAEARVRWHRRVLWPQTVRVGVRASGIGRKHFELTYLVLGEDGEKLISGSTLQVMYDYASGRSVRLDETIRARLLDFDGPLEGEADQGD